MALIEKLCESPVDMNSSEQIQNIVMFLQRSEGLSKHVDFFMQMLSLLQLKDDSLFVLSPLLSDELREANFLRYHFYCSSCISDDILTLALFYSLVMTKCNLFSIDFAFCCRNVDSFHESGENDFDAILAEMEKEMSMGDIMKELGYGCTVDSSQCKEILSLFLPLNEFTISKILGTIACTHAGLEDNQNTFSNFRLALGYSSSSDLPMLNTWNIDVLVDTINQLVSSLLIFLQLLF